MASLIFAVHPAQVESVASISQRKDLLMALFTVWSLWAYLSFRNNRSNAWLAGSVVLAVAALLSKGTAVVVPALVWFTALTFPHSEMPFGQRFRTALLHAIPYGVAVLVIVPLNYAIMSRYGIIVEPLYGGVLERLEIAAVAFFLYVKKALFPYPLSMWNSIEVHEMNLRLMGTLGAAGIALLVAICLIFLKGRPAISFGIGWFVITIAPVLGFASTHYRISERYLLLPLMAICLLVSYLAWLVLSGRTARWRMPVVVSVLFVLIAGLMLVSIRQNGVWRNDRTLLENAIKHEPLRTELYARLAAYHFKQGDRQRAFRLLQTASAIEPVMPDPFFFRALQLYQDGRYREALFVLDEMKTLYGMDYTDIHYLYGMIYEELNQRDKAIESYKAASESRLGIYSQYFKKRNALVAFERLKKHGNESKE
jgi:hypothetical protein